MAKNAKIIPYHRARRVNIGLIIFLLLFVYLCFSATSYLGRKKIRFYEVTSGGMVNDTEHRGIILRTEHLQAAPGSGYVNYYIREGKRAGVGTRIYSLDETGTLKKFLDENADSQAVLSDQNRKELKNRLASFSMSYQPNDFYKVYDSRESIQSVLSEYTSLSMLDSLEQNGSGTLQFQQVVSPESGVVSFNVDGYEDTVPETLTAELFENRDYQPSYRSAGSLVELGSPVYKIIPYEDWKLVFPLTEEEAAAYQDRKSMRITVRGDDLSLSGSFEEIYGADGTAFGCLTFQQFMVRFVGDRFLNFQIQAGSEDGLKIPRSSVTTKEFLLVPNGWLTKGGNSVDQGFMKQTYENGALSARFIAPEIFFQDDQYSYIDSSGKEGLAAGDVLLHPETSEQYQLGPVGTLQGVYNINKGYAVFKQIDIISQNDEYITVRRGTRYGLNVYDHILLEGKEGVEGEPIYK